MPCSADFRPALFVLCLWQEAHKEQPQQVVGPTKGCSVNLHDLSPQLKRTTLKLAPAWPPALCVPGFSAGSSLPAPDQTALVGLQQEMEHLLLNQQQKPQEQLPSGLTSSAQSGAEAHSLHSQQSVTDEGTLRQLFATQQLQDSAAVDALQREQSADEQGTLRRLFQTQKPTEAAGGELQQQSTRQGQSGRTVTYSDILLQQVPSAHHNTHSAAGTHDATLRRRFQAQQLPAAQRDFHSAAGTHGAIVRRLFQCQQLPSPQPITQSAADTHDATLHWLFQT